MEIEKTTEEGKVKIEMTAENPHEWAIIKGIVATADPYAVTMYLRDNGFVTDGKDVSEMLDRIEKKMEE